MKENVDRVYTVYKYTNKENGMVYVGQTSKSLEERANNGNNYKNSTRFNEAINEYGWESFIPEILESGLSAEEASKKEIYYIRLYDSANPMYGYNIVFGGKHPEFPDELKRKISENAIERYKDKTKNPMFGRKHSEEARKKMRDSSRHICGRNNYMFGKHISDDIKEKIRQGLIDYRSTHKDEYEDYVRRSSDRMSGNKLACKKIMCEDDGRVWDSIMDAANDIGSSQQSLCDQLKGRTKSCRGLHFRYIN